MAQEIYNEGRVVGLSAWELFVKSALSNGVDPNTLPTEDQWLASMMGMGASMILKIPSGTSGIQDFELPTGSSLSAANTVLASPFMGSCTVTDAGWATKVTSYSGLIQNNATHSPDGTGVPYDNTYTSSEYRNMVSEFLKITDGIVFTKDANWIPTTGGSPYKDIDPNFNESSTVIRLYISSALVSDIYVIFTGFLNKKILQGLSGYAKLDGGYATGGSTDTDHNDWKNGGMLGPEIVPWATKIIFSVPSSAYVFAKSLSRTIPSDTTYTIPTGGLTIDGITINENAINGDIHPNSFIDFNAINLTDYYDAHNLMNSLLAENISEATFGLNDSVNVMTAWYPGMTAAGIDVAAQAATPSNENFFPPAIYAVQATATGSQYLVPLDTAAPGTVKGFTDSDEAYNYRQLLPNNYAFYYNTADNLVSFVTDSSNPADWPGTAKITYLSSAPKAEIAAGNTTAQFIALTNSSGTAYSTAGTDANPIVLGPTDNLTWDNLLSALTTNKAVDVLGTKLHNLGTELTTNNTIGITNTVTESGANKLTITGTNAVSMTATANMGTNLATLGTNQSIKSGTNFIEFSNGLRLYISGTEPGTSNVPTGSIGIGW